MATADKAGAVVIMDTDTYISKQIISNYMTK